MAKYTITHTCDHTETIQLYGKQKDRQWRIDRAENQDCRDCWSKTEATKAQADPLSHGLPTLAGSAKQISWALSLRVAALKAIDDLVTHAKAESDMSKPECVAELKKIDTAVEQIKSQTTSKFWIDNRGRDPIAVIRQYAH